MDEENHTDSLETQLDLINRVGLELYTQALDRGVLTLASYRRCSYTLSPRDVAASAVPNSVIFQQCRAGPLKQVPQLGRLPPQRRS